MGRGREGVDDGLGRDGLGRERGRRGAREGGKGWRRGDRWVRKREEYSWYSGVVPSVCVCH